MAKTKIEIEQFEDKVAVSGKSYTRFLTGAGWMSCFEANLIKQLKKMPEATVEVAESGDGAFKNIRKIYKDDVETVKVTYRTEDAKARPNFEANKQAGVATRYAVDLAIAGKIEMDGIGEKAAELLQIMKELAK